MNFSECCASSESAVSEIRRQDQHIRTAADFSESCIGSRQLYWYAFLCGRCFAEDPGWKIWKAAFCTTDLGKGTIFQSFPTMKTIEEFTLPEDRNPFGRVMELHQRNASANGKILNYLSQTYLYPTSFGNVVYASQLLQAEAMKRWSRCSQAVYAFPEHPCRSCRYLYIQ